MAGKALLLVVSYRPHRMKIALITGITGQDGSYLAELLLSKGYEVHGTIRRSSSFSTQRIEHIYQDQHEADPKLVLHYGDLSDSENIRKLIFKIKPDEIYNLGAQSHVKVSFDIPEYTANVTGLGVLRVLDAIKDFQEATGKKVRMYQASSSEMFGSAAAPQSEHTPFMPRSPYGCAKVFAFHITKNYRESYGMFVCNGILFNHESPRRGGTFVTKKVTQGVADIKAGRIDKIYLGNLDARRDWGYAPEYCEAMWLMLQQPEPDDYVIGTGKSHTVRDFVIEAFAHAGISDWEKHVEIDPRYYRPAEVDDLRADIAKAQEKLGWAPKTTFTELVGIMVDSDMGAGKAVIK